MDTLRLPLDIFDDPLIALAADRLHCEFGRVAAAWIATLIVAAWEDGGAPENATFPAAVAYVARESSPWTQVAIAAFRTCGLIRDGRIADWARYAPGGAAAAFRAEG